MDRLIRQDLAEGIWFDYDLNKMRGGSREDLGKSIQAEKSTLGVLLDGGEENGER